MSGDYRARKAFRLTNCVLGSFGPTIVGEWGQADTDCTPHLNNVNLSSCWLAGSGIANWGFLHNR